MNVNEYVRKFKPTGTRYPITPRPVCADGFGISIQSNKSSYCTPREDHADSYSSFELGFPSDLDPVTVELIGSYADESGTTETVFGYVPTETIDKLLEAHGGIKWVDIDGTLVDLKLAPLLTDEQHSTLTLSYNR